MRLWLLSLTLSRLCHMALHYGHQRQACLSCDTVAFLAGLACFFALPGFGSFEAAFERAGNSVSNNPASMEPAKTSPPPPALPSELSSESEESSSLTGASPSALSVSCRTAWNLSVELELPGAMRSSNSRVLSFAFALADPPHPVIKSPNFKYWPCACPS